MRRRLAVNFQSFVNLANVIASHPLTRERKLQALHRIVRWQMLSRLRPELIVPWVDDARLAVSRGMTGATGNIYFGLHEFEDMAFLLHFLRPGDLFADVGANIGSYTILASAVCGARTVAFEPDPDTFAALTRNIALNRVGDLVDSREAALGSQVGSVSFTVGLDTLNRIATEAAGPARTVAMDTLDHALNDLAPNLIKLDVEGFERDVLGGAERTLGDPELKAIITEDRSPLVVALLQTAKFAEYGYDPFTRRLRAVASGERKQNALFVRDRDFVAQRLAAAKQVRVLDRLL